MPIVKPIDLAYMTYLDAILNDHRITASEDTRSLDQLVEKARQLEPANSFKTAIQNKSQNKQLSVISEIKRASPSKGDLERHASIESIEAWAQCYEEAGAACISVLTDNIYFKGSVEDLQIAKEHTSLPILRKDFTVSALDVVDTKIMGAAAVLLIVAALDQSQLKDFVQLATEIGLDAVVETHDEREVETALNCEAQIIGINQRDLHTFKIDTQRAIRVLNEIPKDITRIAESGIKNVESAQELKEAGFDAILVGESIVTSQDPAKYLSELTHL